MTKFFNIIGLENSYGNVSGEEVEGKHYLSLGDYSGFSRVEISKEAFEELFNQFDSE